MKGDQVYTLIYNHKLQYFQDRISSCTLRYVDIYIYNMTCITCYMYKKIIYFVTCETSDVTMSTTCMSVI